MINEESAKALSAHIQGKELVWAGRPKQGLMFTTQDFFLLPFGMFGCGFAYFLMIMPDMLKAPMAVAYFGWLVMLLSLYFSLARFAIDSALRAKTFYGLSSDAAYIKVGNKIEMIDLAKAKRIKLDANVDSSGNIWFKSQTTVQMLLGNSLNGLPFVKHPAAFMFIPNVKAVFAKIAELKKV